MNRRSFFKAASGLLLAAAVPLAVEPERRIWALDRTMVTPGRSFQETTGFIDKAAFDKAMRAESLRLKKALEDAWLEGSLPFGHVYKEYPVYPTGTFVMSMDTHDRLRAMLEEYQS